jgi:hypothetical protein
MNIHEWLIAALILLPACAAVAWVLSCMTQSEDDLRDFTAVNALPTAHAHLPNAGTAAAASAAAPKTRRGGKG